jgi:hypothetical protein
MNISSIASAKDPVILTAEDRNRMARLYEEVQIRLEEMAMITARTLRVNVGRGTQVRFCPWAPGAEFEVEAVELIRTQHVSGGYNYKEGTCFQVDGAGAEACPHP